MTQTVAQIMTTSPIALSQETPLREAARMMRDEGIGDVLVTRGDGALAGIVTDRDIVVRAVAEGRGPDEARLGDICSTGVLSLSPEDDSDAAVRMMREHGVRRIPVTEGDRVVGIVSLGDLAQSKDRLSALADISAAPPDM